MKASQAGIENQHRNYAPAPQRRSKKEKLRAVREKKKKQANFLDTYRGKTPWNEPRSIFWKGGSNTLPHLRNRLGKLEPSRCVHTNKSRLRRLFTCLLIDPVVYFIYQR